MRRTRRPRPPTPRRVPGPFPGDTWYECTAPGCSRPEPTLDALERHRIAAHTTEAARLAAHAEWVEERRRERAEEAARRDAIADRLTLW